jgi:chemotaxis methyl-accepting protein methylase
MSYHEKLRDLRNEIINLITDEIEETFVEHQDVIGLQARLRKKVKPTKLKQYDDLCQSLKSDRVLYLNALEKLKKSVS